MSEPLKIEMQRAYRNRLGNRVVGKEIHDDGIIEMRSEFEGFGYLVNRDGRRCDLDGEPHIDGPSDLDIIWYWEEPESEETKLDPKIAAIAASINQPAEQIQADYDRAFLFKHLANGFAILEEPALPGLENAKPSIREKTLEAAKACVLQDRNVQYGAPEDSFKEIAARWSLHLGVEVSSHDVASMLIDLKLVRAKTSPKKADHWVDIAGYAACGAETAGAK